MAKYDKSNSNNIHENSSKEMLKVRKKLTLKISYISIFDWWYENFRSQLRNGGIKWPDQLFNNYIAFDDSEKLYQLPDRTVYYEPEKEKSFYRGTWNKTF